MSSADAPRSSPVARIHRSALLANIRTAQAEGATAVADDALRADAWGHGEALVREVLADAGMPIAGSGGQVIEPAALYGLPGGGAHTVPVLRLVGAVLSVKAVRAGEGVSYGYTYRAPADTRAALVTGGYAHGVVRALGNRIRVRIADRRLPVVGRVAMDVCVVDVSDASVRRGDEVVFFGDRGDTALGDWAAATGLTPAELVTSVGLHAVREVAP